MEEFIYTLKQQIITMLNIDGIKPEDIDDSTPLFGDGLGLESLDALELCWIMEKYYGIRLKNLLKEMVAFKSVAEMADFIQKNRTK